MGIKASESPRIFAQLEIEPFSPPLEGKEEILAALCNLHYGFRLYTKANVRSTPRITKEVKNEIDDAVTACVKNMSGKPAALVDIPWCDTKEIYKLKIGEMVTHGECLIELARVAPARKPTLRNDKGWHRELLPCPPEIGPELELGSISWINTKGVLYGTETLHFGKNSKVR
jgi:hypothetical protein